MKKHPYLYTLIALIIAAPFISRYMWSQKEEKPLNILIVDKTVIDKSAQEHKPLFWILDNQKYIKKNATLYDINTDYYGFFPDGQGGFKIKDFSTLSDSAVNVLSTRYDMAYYTDLYGVYSGEWYERYSNIEKSGAGVASLEPSEMIYGGMSMAEFYMLKQLRSSGKLVITEFNVIGTPTPTAVSREFEREFKMSWLGWVGRFYSSLDTNSNKELPIWLKKNYIKQNGGRWPFKRSGIVFVRADEKIVILEDKTHLKRNVPIIETAKNYRSRYGLPKTMKYHYWFDIIAASDSLDVISTYTLKVNEDGKKVLDENFIPNSFPAVVKDRKGLFYYFAGDFSDINISMVNTKFQGVATLNNWVVRAEGESRSAFFWRYYQPLVGTIIGDYYEGVKKKGSR